MTTRSVRTRLLAALASALPATAAALDLSGHVGASYSRLQLSLPGAESTTQPHLDLDLGLEAGGAIVRPEVVDWNLAGSYRRISDQIDGTSSNRQSFFFYDARATLFRSPSAPATILLSASRTSSDFSTNLALDVFGQSVTDLARASVVLRPESLVPVNAGYFFRNLDETIPGQALHHRTTHGIDAAVASGSSAYHMSASYGGELNDGTWTTDQYDLHNVSVQVGAPIRTGLEVAIDERYYRLDPRTTAVGAVGQDNNALRAYLRDTGTFGDRHAMEYLYAHAITEVPGSPLAETARNALRYEGDHLLTSPTFFTRWLAELSLNQDRLGTADASSSGETAGVQLWWRRVGGDRLYEIYGGPLVGFIQSDLIGDKTGYGGTATARATQPWAGQVARASYEASYASDLYGIAGWNLRHALTGSVEGALWTGRYSALLRASSLRSYSATFGDGATRSIEAYATAAIRRFDFDLRGVVESGLTGATPGEFMGDGLFIPAPFDTSNQQLAVQGRMKLVTGLNARTNFRIAATRRPGQPHIDQTEVIGAIEYQYAALYFSIEDRIDWYDQATGRSIANTIFVRVYRRFDSRF